MFYSPQTQGFYSSEIHGEDMPADVVEITEERHAELLEGQSAGQRIIPGDDGFPVLADRVVGVPQSVTRFQALAALHLSGHLQSVKAIMAAPETPVMAKLAWDNALSFERSSPTLAGLATALGLTDADLDALFTAAAGISA